MWWNRGLATKPLTSYEWEGKEGQNWSEIIFNMVNWNLGLSLLKMLYPKLFSPLFPKPYLKFLAAQFPGNVLICGLPWGTAYFLPRKRFFFGECFLHWYPIFTSTLIPAPELVNPADSVTQKCVVCSLVETKSQNLVSQCDHRRKRKGNVWTWGVAVVGNISRKPCSLAQGLRKIFNSQLSVLYVIEWIFLLKILT